MDTLIERITCSIPKDVFSDKELKLIFPFSSPAGRHNKVKREVAKGNLVRLMRGVYCLSEKHQKTGINLFEVSHYLYCPSYISLESALSYYGLIPEAVYTTTSVTTKRSAIVNTSLGLFSFKRLPVAVFKEGFMRVATDNHIFLIASPLKAFLDLMYLQKKSYNSLKDVEEDLRLDLTILKKEVRKLGNREILSCKDMYSNKGVAKVIELILWELL